MVEISSDANINPNNERFFHSPIPVIFHIISVTVYCLLGAFQFSKGLRQRILKWHRLAGRILIPSGLIAALSGLWMSHFYILPPMDGQVLYVVRLIVGAAMLISLVLGYRSIMNRDFKNHEAWMIRAYALGIGAGTQVFTHLPWVIFFGDPEVGVRAILMTAGWGINMIIAEWVIRRKV